MSANERKNIIRISYEIITPESAEDGDVEERGWEDEEGTEYDDVEEAIRLLRGSEPSSSEFHKDVWYTSYGDQDTHDGSTTNLSYHLSGWSEEDERTIYEAVGR